MADAGTTPVTYPRVHFLRAPFASRTWRETLDTLLNLPIGLVSFTYVVTLLTLGIGTSITWIGIPVIAATVAGARGWAAMERARSGALLGTRVAAPGPARRPGSGALGWIKAAVTDVAGWRALLYLVLLLPLGLVSFLVAVVFWSVALAATTYPLWFSFPPEGVVFSAVHESLMLSRFQESFLLAGVGLVLLLVTPWLVHAFASLRGAMTRGLLGNVGKET